MTNIKKEPSKEYMDELIRVNHAGEYAAKRIYQGQIKYIKGENNKELISHMLQQEEEHLIFFESELRKRKVRPTALSPIWHVAGFALGAISAMMGEKAAMACTRAVEEVIEGHYQAQIANISDKEIELKKTIQKFMDEEIEHKQIAEKHSDSNPGHLFVFEKIVRFGCKLAIKIAKKI